MTPDQKDHVVITTMLFASIGLLLVLFDFLT